MLFNYYYYYNYYFQICFCSLDTRDLVCLPFIFSKTPLEKGLLAFANLNAMK